MNRKLATLPSVKALGARTFRFKLSDGTLDRDGDAIEPEGWRLGDYKRNPVVLWAHQHTIPAIGKCPAIGIVGDALVGDIEFPAPGVYPFADEIRGLVEAGILTTSSVGFRPEQATPTRTGHKFHAQTLLEWSIVNVPSNPAASLQGLSPKAAYQHAVVKSFLQVEDRRALRLEPHVRGLDLPTLTKWLGGKSDQAPAMYCPKGDCPSKAGQLNVADCPFPRCPLRAVTGQKEAVYDVDLEDEVTFDSRDLPALKDALLGELRGEVRAMVRPLLRRHLTATTGRLD
jgi:hypothetical protein